MQVYFDKSCGSKFGKERLYCDNICPPLISPTDPPCIIFFHATGKKEVMRYLNRWEKNVSALQMAICYLSAAPNCGLTEKEIEEIEIEYNNIVHIYKTALPGLSEDEKTNSDFIKQLKLFMQEAKDFNQIQSINWQLLYLPSYPEYLVTAYLLLVAEQGGLVVNELDDTNLWKEAGKQFCEEVAKRNLSIANGNLISDKLWFHPKGDNISKCISSIRSLFENIEGAQVK